MDQDERCVSEMILNLTLEIIYLLTGEDYGPVKKSSGCGERLSSTHPCVSGGWSMTQGPNAEPPCLSLTNQSSKEILRVTNKIIELMTGEVPIRCQDVAVYFSMEEWKYLEHGDLYKEAMIEEEHTCGMMAGEHLESKDPEDDGCVNSTQNGGFHESSSKPFHTEHFQNIGEVLEPTEHCLQVYGCDQNEKRGPKLCSAMDQSASGNRGGCGISVSTKPQEESSLVDNSVSIAQEQSGVEHCEELSEILRNHMEGSYLNQSRIKLELKQDDGPNVTEILQITSLDQLEMGGVPADIGDSSKLALAFGQTSCNGGSAFCFNDQSQFDLGETSHIEQIQFECSECGEYFARNSQLVEHHRLHSVEKPFACPECGKQFADRAKVVAHQLIHSKLSEPKIEVPTLEGLVLCSECGMGFSNGPALEEHQKVHKQDKAFVCPVCGKSFSRRGHLSNHSRIHTGGKRVTDRKYFPHGSYIRKRSFMCPECGKWFPSRSHLDRHQRIHTGEKPFSCTECDKRFTDRSGLVIHQRTHTGEKPYACDFCAKRFRDRSGLVVHQRYHTGTHPFKCLQCGKCFHNRPRLERHMNIHIKKRGFSCPECGQCFPSMSTLTRHRQTHFAQMPPLLESTGFPPPPAPQTTPNSLCCPECGKSFADLSTFSLHLSTHKAADQQVQAFSMPVSFEPQRRLLNAEPSLRLGQSQPVLQRMEKPYPCSQCDQSFSDRTSLLAHEGKHSEEKPYKCSKCGEGFVLKGYLTKHLQTHG